MKGQDPLKRRARDIYKDPLPFNIEVLPPLSIHNPISLLYYLYRFITACPRQVVHAGELMSDGTVKIVNPKSSQDLWRRGFFGKGTLSRSEPSWYGRTMRRLGLDGGELTFEELTEQRRQRRRKFKRERDLSEKRELVKKRQTEGLPEDKVLTAEIEKLEEPLYDDFVSTARGEDTALLIDSSNIIRLEHLQLTPYEAVFLSLGLGVLDTGSTISHLLEVTLGQSAKRLREYIVYHYFRSRGWCIRSGVKFGTDFILYRRGPPFHHADFAVNVASYSQKLDWQTNQATMRVVGGVKKTLIIAYVEGPDFMEWSRVTSIGDFSTILKQFKVKPITFFRWAPTRTRD